MATANEKLLDNTVNHSIDIQRFGNGVVRRMLAILNKADAKLTDELISALERMTPENFTVQRLDALLKEVRALNGKAYTSVRTGLEVDLLDLVKSESDYQMDLFKDVLPIRVSVAKIDPEVVYTAAMSRPFQVSKDKAVPLNEYLTGLSSDRAAKIRDAVRLGYLNSETTSQIVRTIRGTKTQNYADGLMQGPRYHVEGMVRTAISHMSNFTAQRFYDANSELLKGWRFVATLDGRTSDICKANDGKVFPIGSGPVLPLHIGERSRSSPVTKSWRELGIDFDEISPGTRASMDGQVPADLTYNDWLKKQSTERQNDILGPTKAKLFRAGQSVDKFVDNKGKTLTIQQLRERNSALFYKLGL